MRNDLKCHLPSNGCPNHQSPRVQAAYADGVTPSSLLLLRFGIAAVCMAAVALLRRERFPRKAALGGVALMGGVGYVGQSVCFFTALTMAHAGHVALLQEPLGATAVFGGLLILVGAVMLSGDQTPDAPRVVTD